MDRLRRLCGAGVLALGLAFGAPVLALSVSPTHVEIDGVQATRASVRVTAPGNAPLVLDLSIVERSADGTVAPAHGPAFQLQPPQVFVPAGQSTDITLHWTGSTPAVGSRSFYLVAEQLPVAMERGDGQNHLHVLARVHVPVHVGTSGVAEPHVRHDHPARIALTNTGVRHARFADLVLRVTATSGGSRDIDGIELARAIESDALLPGAEVGLDASMLGLRDGERAVALVKRR